MTSSDTILSLRSVVIGFMSGSRKKTLLPPLNANAGRGELIAVIGRNGIGKSTMIRTLASVQKPLGGDVLYFGEKSGFYSGTELAKIAGYISTEMLKVSNMNVYDLVSLGRLPYTNWLGSLTGEDRNIINHAIKRTGISHLTKRYIGELSDGERQKAMISRLLAQNTDIMLMDEPTAFLDVRSKFEILHLMYTLTRAEKKTIIFSTHDLEMATRHADKIWLMFDDGITEGAPEDLLIKGKFDHLFESSVVLFNSEDGSFSFNDRYIVGKVCIEGSGKNLYWTAEALKRTGFIITSESAALRIHVSDDAWVLSGHNSGSKFTSIYDLVKALLQVSVF